MGKRKKRPKIYERALDDDIRYRGPLSYLHLQIIGWLAISFKILDMLIKLAVMIDPNQPQWMLTLGNVSSYIGELALPLFLFANFAILLDGKRTFKQQLLKFGGLSLLIVILFLLATEHLALGIGTAVTNDRGLVQQGIIDFLYDQSNAGKLSFNLFIDLFLCTLLLFFLDYTPRRFFVGKKRFIFRAFALFPIAYEVGALAIRILSADGTIKPPLIVYPLLTAKPLMSFFLFIILVLFIKFREVRFKRHGKSKEEYYAFTQTNRHSLHFSVFASIMILITGIIDIILYFIITFMRSGLVIEYIEQASEELIEKTVEANAYIVAAWGIGGHFAMVLIIPIILLFSYTRKCNNPMVELAVPAGGILLAAIVAIEGLYQGLVMNIPILMESAHEIVSQFLMR